ncbi:hypothetical protein CYMTET_13586 [Cymbomonas tetramitiformis]|uniref:Ion transport domain-containing protein n=1 Tax=Cymbomonas tetramitiformis TaxID=36881 RepID=A0AAE0LB99_9CHLO|nr:hypothetical protein CYMTET_13586 [Cymbomonas tetramitiformis]
MLPVSKSPAESLADNSSTPVSETSILHEFRPSWHRPGERRIVNGVPVPNVPSLYRSLSSRSRRSRRASGTIDENLLPPENEDAQRVILAAQYVHDALEGHSQTIIEDNPIALFAAKLQRNVYYKIFIRSVMLFQLGLLFLEPVTRKAHESNFPLNRAQTAALELGCVCLLALEIAMTYVCLGRTRFCRKRFNVCNLCVVVFIGIDIVVLYYLGGVQLRLTRALRPLLIISHVRWLRQVVSTILKTIPRVSDLFGVVLVLILCYAQIGVGLFGDVYHKASEYGLSAEGAFDDTMSASVALTVLLTTENFPDVFRPAFHHDKFTALVYFLSYFLIGVWMTMSLLLAIIFTTYKEKCTDKVARTQQAEQKSLLTAYIIMQDSGEPLDFMKWCMLLKHVKPSPHLGIDGALLELAPGCLPPISAEPALQTRRALISAPRLCPQVLFDSLDSDGDEMITIEEFFRLPEVLNYRLHRSVIQTDAEEGSTLRSWMRRTMDKPALSLGQLADTEAFIRGAHWLTVINSVVVALRGLAKMPDEGRMMLAGINLLILLMFAAELICRWCKLGTNGLYREWGLDFLVVAASLVCGFGNAFDIYNTVSWMYPYMSALQVLRILSTRKEFRSLVETFFECLPMVLEMVTVTFCILYFYSVVGMELFSTSIVGDVPYCSKGGDSPVNTGDAKKDICLDDIENFQTPGHAMLALFQIITSNNWNDVMYPNVVANIKISGTGFPGYFYFISFFTLMVLLVINLMTCLVIDIYESRRDVIEREGQKAQQLRYAQEAGGEVVYTLVQVRDWTRKLMGRRPHETQSEALEQSIITLEEEVAQQEVKHLQAVLRARDQPVDGVWSNEMLEKLVTMETKDWQQVLGSAHASPARCRPARPPSARDSGSDEEDSEIPPADSPIRTLQDMSGG